MSERARVRNLERNQMVLPTSPLWGHLPDFARNPLDFLSRCVHEERDIVSLRFFHRTALLFTAPADIERILVTDHAKFRKPDWLRTSAVRRLLGDSLVNAEGEAWRLPREASQPAFHARLMNDYGNTLAGVTENYLREWRPGDVRDVQGDMTRLTLEIIARTLFSVEGNAWTEDVEGAMNVLMSRFSSRTSLYGMMPWLASKPERDAVKRINTVVDRFITEHRLDGDGETGDLLSRLEAAGYYGDALREPLKTFLAAGYESSALSLTWAFYALAKHPEAEARLAQELQTILNGRPPTAADLPGLVYTKAVIKETLRLYPPLWMTGRQTLAPYEIGGTTVPADTLLMTSQWAMHRHPRYFARPDEFRPERWFDGETDALPRYAYFPFGGGPRVCIGQGFAMLELTLVLAAVLRRFRLELIEDGDGADIKPWATMMLRPSKPIHLKIRDRESFHR